MLRALNARPGGLDVIPRPTGELEEGSSQCATTELCLRKGSLAVVCDTVQSWEMGKMGESGFRGTCWEVGRLPPWQ